jgi:acyl-coenzyme A thioesterase PaaI-like protein
MLQPLLELSIKESIHLWEIRITDENENLISICKLTNMILPKEKKRIKSNGGK